MTAGLTVSLKLTPELAERVRQVAARNNRSVETVLLEGLSVLFGAPPEETDQALAALDSFSDEQLWAVVYQRLAWPDRERLRDLIERGKQGALKQAEQAELETLLDRTDQYTVWRSKALNLLKQRGYDIGRYLKVS